MKPVFKCDYCSEIGTKEEIREHELYCTNNYNRRSCFTCAHKKISCSHNIQKDERTLVCKCKLGKEVPEGKFFEFCESYEKREKSDNPLNDLIYSAFGL